MKTALRSLSILLLAAAGPLLGAAPETAAAGKFLVLRNGRTLEGDIERVGEQYRVRRDGAETWIAANLVLRLFRDTEDAYQFLRARTNLNDAADRLRLARWCLDVRLRERALEEATAAALLRPKDAATQQFLERLRQPTPAAPATAAPAPAHEPEPPTALPVNLTPEALGQFTRRVQPILLNACASCHAGEHGGSFKLTKTSEFAALNRKVSQENLAAVLAQVRLDRPQASPLLTKAVTVHGGGDRAPLGERQAVAYRALEDWVKNTLAHEPQLQDKLATSPAPMTTETRPTFADVQPDAPHAAPPPVHPVPITPAELAPTPAAPAVAPRDNGDDAYDPSVFNRQAHPERDKAPAPKP